ncbi:T9SS type A sorting domain-containing protein [Flavobacterium sp. XS2P12]|uniref:T9SS type A sorting domain-containing protein n=1 Tax=Flavobacterium melibiosi TaxID=3398734 RepID=UPI003A8775C8
MLPSQDGTTGSSLTWTALPAGVNYYVVATGAAPTNCTSQTANAAVTEIANPVVYTLSGNSICASAPNTGIITLSNSQTGVSYQLKKASDNTPVQPAQTGTTGSQLTWTALPAGVPYYVLATGAAPTNCTSQTANASVTEVANPVVYTLSGNSICASAPNTGVITLSNSQTGVSYQLKKASDNTPVLPSQNGTTGSSLTWTALPAGVPYYVLATGAAPTNCTSQTANASVTEVVNPVVYTLSGNSICASAPNTGVITLSNSQTGVSYQLKKASDNTPVLPSQNGTTGSSLTWTALPAGVPYYVLATGAAPTNCTSQTANASVTEVANPVVYTLSGNSICASAPNTGVITLSNSQTGVSYQLKKASDNTPVLPSQNGITGSSLTWTALPAGVSYYVLATGAAPTNCTSQTANASVTEVANPVVYTLSGNSICASAPNTGVITLSNSQTGVSYQLKKASDNTPVLPSQNGTTGSSLTWTALPAGVSYYVLATGAAPTNCTSQTANAAVTEVANPPAPIVTYNAPACNESTFSITVSGVISGGRYTVLDKNGNAITGISPSVPYDALNTNNIIFSNIPAGSGYKVSVLNNGCGSSPSSCPATAKVISPSAEKTDTIAPIETKIETAGFDAYPVPFKDLLTIKYNFDYVSDVKIEVFNAQGISILSKLDTNSYLNKEIVLDLKLNRGKEQVYIVKVTTNRGSSVKKVMSSR